MEHVVVLHFFMMIATFSIMETTIWKMSAVVVIKTTALCMTVVNNLIVITYSLMMATYRHLTKSQRMLNFMSKTKYNMIMALFAVKNDTETYDEHF